MIAVQRPPLEELLNSEQDEQFTFCVSRAARKLNAGKILDGTHTTSLCSIPGFVGILSDVFHQKCAFCERPLPADEATINYFRPVNQKYHWLRVQWSNMYSICKDCIDGRDLSDNLFPITGHKATVWDFGVQALYEMEKPILLDPCFQNPQHGHFSYQAYSEENACLVTIHGESSKGLETIAHFQLNRPELKTQRGKVYIGLVTELESRKLSFQAIRAFCDEKHPFAGMCRFFVREWLKDFKFPDDEWREFGKQVSRYFDAAGSNIYPEPTPEHEAPRRVKPELEKVAPIQLKPEAHLQSRMEATIELVTAPSSVPQPHPHETLRQKIAKHFNLNELKDLCLFLGVEFENLSGDRLLDKSRELVQLFIRLNDLDRLLSTLVLKRPRVSWHLII